MGTERYLSWSTWERGRDAADAARDDGYTVIGLELADDAIPLHQLTRRPDVCLAVGHEDHGLTRPPLAACDAVAFIPQLGRVGSLNVATARIHRHLRAPPPGEDLDVSLQPGRARRPRPGARPRRPGDAATRASARAAVIGAFTSQLVPVGAQDLHRAPSAGRPM